MINDIDTNGQDAFKRRMAQWVQFLFIYWFICLFNDEIFADAIPEIVIAAIANIANNEFVNNKFVNNTIVINEILINAILRDRNMNCRDRQIH